MNKNRVFLSVITAGAIFSAVYFGGFLPSNQQASLPLGTEPSRSESPSPTPVLSATKQPIASKAPLPTQDNRTTFIDESVPWRLLSGPAYCELKGEIKFLDHKTYDNQDALFIYNGVDHPGRNILWTVTPADNLSIGPNLFSKIPIPDGTSLLGIVLPENPKYKRYELTAKIQYGRLVDGNVKVFEKQCDGKTAVVLP